MVAQSFVLQPFIYLPTFFAVNAYVRRWSADELERRVRSDFLPTLGRIWVFWTPAVCFAFGKLPKHQQAVFFAAFGCVWNVVLSLTTNPTKRASRTNVQ